MLNVCDPRQTRKMPIPPILAGVLEGLGVNKTSSVLMSIQSVIVRKIVQAHFSARSEVSTPIASGGRDVLSSCLPFV